jgi:hypothetical protein
VRLGLVVRVHRGAVFERGGVSGKAFIAKVHSVGKSIGRCAGVKRASVDAHSASMRRPGTQTRKCFSFWPLEKAEVVANCDHLRKLKFSPVLPRAFTEHGAIMAANVLNSRRAVQMSVFVVRAFVKMRGTFADTRDLAKKLGALEQEIKGRLDIHEAAIVDVLQRIMKILDPPSPPPEPPPTEIGFHVREEAVRYRIRWKAPR